MNNISITGRITATPELKTTPNGVSVCSFNLAVKRPHTKDVTDFIPCQLWRQGAEYLTKYGAKGNMVAVTGALTTRKWQDQNGNNRINYEVLCDSVELLESRQSGEVGNNTTGTTNAQKTALDNATARVTYDSSNLEELTDDDELPF